MDPTTNKWVSKNRLKDISLQMLTPQDHKKEHPCKFVSRVLLSFMNYFNIPYTKLDNWIIFIFIFFFFPFLQRIPSRHYNSVGLSTSLEMIPNKILTHTEVQAVERSKSNFCTSYSISSSCKEIKKQVLYLKLH